MFVILDTHDALALAQLDEAAVQGLRKIAEHAGDVVPDLDTSHLPDRAFCLLFDGPGGRQRRYPAHTEAHTRLALAEFGAFGQHLQPAQTAKIAGAHLIRACERFDLPVPEDLAGFRDPTVTTNLAPAPQAPVAKLAARQEDEHYALTLDGRGRYPLRNRLEVKVAGAYFDRHLPDLPPQHRHPMARKTAERARQLGVAVPQSVQDWAVHAYSPLLKHAMVSRVAAAQGSHRQQLLSLCRERAHVDPDEFARRLYRIDCKHGCADYHRQRADPWTCVFFRASDAESGEPSKTAPATQVLWKAAAAGRLIEVLGADVAQRFLESPETTAPQMDPVALAALKTLVA